MFPLRALLPARETPVVTWALIAFNALAFLYERSMVALFGERFLFAWGFVPRRFLADPLVDWPTLLSSMFMHAGWLHLAGNMLFLWVFGRNVEDHLGRARYLIFYLASGVAAAGAQLAIDPRALVPMLGASGAIAGVLGAYGYLYPRVRVVTLVPIVFFIQIFELPAWLVIGEWFVLQLIAGLGSLTMPGAAGGVAVFAHIGGFAAGMVLISIFAHKPRLSARAAAHRPGDPWRGYGVEATRPGPSGRPW